MNLPIDAPEVAHSALRWVPIRSLAARHRPRILAHLLSLSAEDRYLRFGYAASDAQIGRYIDQIDFERDEVFGIFNRRLEVVAMAHLAYLGAVDLPQTTAEFGVSVVEAARGRGWGARLFDRAVLHARNRHVSTLVIHALAENKAMLHIARQAGAVVEFRGPDATALLTLPPENLASQVTALVEQQVAEIDYGVKAQVQRVDAWLSALQDPSAALGGRPPESRGADDRMHTQARDRGEPPPV